MRPPTIETSDIIIEDVTEFSYEDESWQCENETMKADETENEEQHEAKLLTVKETLENYANSLFAFQVRN